ncbi:cob(I)yrinic acid a,c-diamide adenosyltransferase [Candidatus Bipolaricaulota bacterium]|nr:cob(I)yrinic acid a,c-diamide adenosyltransferase [Candidatus Bipolaricaulota bacterium]
MEGSGEEMGGKGGKVLVHTGKGKGKTTSAIGQIVRAVGQGLAAKYVSFFKGNEEQFQRGTITVLRKLNVPTKNFVRDHPGFGRTSENRAQTECVEALEYLEEYFSDEEEICDLLVLDEVNVALESGYVKEEEFLSLLEMKPDDLELVCTGRGAPESLIEEADLVSRIENVKHFYDDGVVQRPGYEY